MKRWIITGLLIFGLLGLLCGCGKTASGTEDQANAAAQTEAAVEADDAGDGSGDAADISGPADTGRDTAEIAYTFRSKKLLDQHFEKHGLEMGFSSPSEYEKAASAVANDPHALHKTEKEDGHDVYYIEATNEFVVVSTDGYIRTYFCPNVGKAYFDRQ